MRIFFRRKVKVEIYFSLALAAVFCFSYRNGFLERETKDAAPDDDDTARQERNTTLDDVLITVKTTARNHRARLAPIILTWFQQAKNQTYIVTDSEDYYHENRTDNRMVNTYCPPENHLCKMAKELELFRPAAMRWWCFFDDDTYVNVPQLLNLLNKYNWKGDHYIGRSPKSAPFTSVKYKGVNFEFQYGSRSAGACVSNGLATVIGPYVKQLRMIGPKILQRADDVVLGFVISYFGATPLTTSLRFHSHKDEIMADISTDDLPQQVTLSYEVGDGKSNVVDIQGRRGLPFPKGYDPTRLFSIHCLSFSKSGICVRTNSLKKRGKIAKFKKGENPFTLQ